MGDQLSIGSKGGTFQTASSWEKYFYPLFACAALLLLLSHVPVLYQRIHCAFQLQQDEAYNLELGRILLKGETLYQDIRVGGPYNTSYTIGFPFLLSLSMRIFQGLWLPGRILSLVGYLVCGILFLLWGWKRWGPSKALGMASLFWLFPTWESWGTMARMDALMLSFNFASFFLVSSQITHASKSNETDSWKVLSAAGLLNASAILMKPTAISLTLAVLLTGLLYRKWRALLIFLASLMVPYLAVTLYEQWNTGGYYLLCTFRWMARGFHWEYLWAFLKGPFLPEGGWLLAGVLAVLALRKIPVLLACQVVISIFAMSSLARESAAENYYMEFLIYGLLTIGEGFFIAAPRLIRGRSFPAPVLMTLGLALLAVQPLPRLPSQEEMADKAAVLTIYQEPGDHLAIDADLPYMAGKRVWYQSSGVMPLVHNGLWDAEPLVEDVENRRFSTIEMYDLPDQYLLPENVVAAVLKYYQPAVKKFGRVWYVPLQGIAKGKETPQNP